MTDGRSNQDLFDSTPFKSTMFTCFTGTLRLREKMKYIVKIQGNKFTTLKNNKGVAEGCEVVGEQRR